MNGTILGMTKREIDRKFDEIVDFSGVERFLDTPVKRYSSGMQVRLAFSVAAHLEPEILIVDEVLAVGDAEFQKKCLGKMQDVAGRGRTVLFVSHNMGMITSLCRTGLLMESGGISAVRTASETVLAYSSRRRSSPQFTDFTALGRPVGDHLATLLEARIEDMQGNRVSEVDIRNPFTVKMQYELRKGVPKPPYPNFHFFDERGECAFVSSGNDTSRSGGQPGTYEAECVVPGRLLNNGTFFIGVALTFTHHGIHVSFYEKDALSVSIRDPIDETLEDMRSGYSGHIPGPVRPKLDWRIQRIPQMDKGIL
jgi:lipopolysaccharide transport system ATP-binding protein